MDKTTIADLYFNKAESTRIALMNLWASTIVTGGDAPSDDTLKGPPLKRSIADYAWDEIYDEFIDWRTDLYATDKTASWGIELKYKSGDHVTWNYETESGKVSAWVTCYVHNYGLHDTEFYTIDLQYEVTWDDTNNTYRMKEIKRVTDHWDPTSPYYQ